MNDDLIHSILRHMTMTELAVKMSVSFQTVYNWKRGRSIHPARLAKLRSIKSRLEKKHSKKGAKR